jgi:hypothetical protein
LDQSLAAIRADMVKNPNTYGLNGANIVVGQIEPGEPNENHNMLTGRTSRRNISTTDHHATFVAGIMVGAPLNLGGGVTIEGLAPSARLYSAGYNNFSRPANFAELRGNLNFMGQAPRAHVINMSSGYFVAGTSNFLQNEDGSGPEARLIDWSSIENGFLFVQAAGNNGSGANTIIVPGDFYNGLTVGATGAVPADMVGSGNPSQDYRYVVDYSSRGPTADPPGAAGPRHKPDLVAPGSQILSSGWVMGDNNAVTRDTFGGGAFINVGQAGFQDPYFDLNNSGTRQPNEPYWDTIGNGVYSGAGDRYSNPIGNPIVLNDADGNGVIQTQINGTSFAAPHVTGAAALLYDYSNKFAIGSPRLWIKSLLLNGASKQVVDPRSGLATWPERAVVRNGAGNPLHNAMGVGMLNVQASVENYSTPGANQTISIIGMQTMEPGATYLTELNRLGETLKPGSLVTATVTWDREVEYTGNDTEAQRNDPTKYVDRGLTNLKFELIKRGTNTVVAVSDSPDDNVEHLYFNVRDEGHYDLRVTNPTVANGGRRTTVGGAMTAGTSDGLAFSVAPNAEGNIGFHATYPNDVHSLGRTGPANYQTEGELFVSSQNNTNMQRISGALGTQSRVGPHNAPPSSRPLLYTGERGVLGLQSGDDIGGLSWGEDGTQNQDSTLVFSVNAGPNRGVVGSDVLRESGTSPVGGAANPPFPINPGGGQPGFEAAGDIFKTPMLGRFGRYASGVLDPSPKNSNRQYLDESALGLQAPAARGSLLGGPEDDLDALEIDNLRAEVDQDGDGIHNNPIFFTLGRNSPSLGGDFNANDIFVSFPKDPSIVQFNFEPTEMFNFVRFADGTDNIGLAADDAIDALILSDVGFEGNPDGADGLLAAFDEALFSFDPLSPGRNPGDIYYTDFNRVFDPTVRWDMGGSLFATAAEIGLRAMDNLDALDIFSAPPVPEPGALVLALCAVAFLPRRRRRL